MKRRKNLIIAFLLVASLALGIGYAAYSTTLTINGITGVSEDAIEFTQDVQFTTASSDNEAFGTADIGNGQVASFETTGMTQYNDRVQFTYTILNNSEFDVNIEITTRPIKTSGENLTTSGAPLFTVTTALGANSIPAGQSITATVTVVLNENVTAVVPDIGWQIEYTATSVD